MSFGETVASVTKAALDTFQQAMQQSYDKGYNEGFSSGFDAGFAAAKKEMLEMISGMAKRYIGENIENIQTQPEETDSYEDRAAPGTVKPAILKLIESHPEGLSKSQIVALSGIKPNSVRGTLWSLHKEGQIFKAGRDRWVPGNLHSDDTELEFAEYEEKEN